MCSSTHTLWVWPVRLTFTGATDIFLVALCTVAHTQQVWPKWLTFTGSVVGRVKLVALRTVAHAPCGCGSTGMVTRKSQRTAGSWQSNGNNWTPEQGKCHGKYSLHVVMDTPCVCISVDLIMYKLCIYIYTCIYVCVDIPIYHSLWSLIVSVLCCFKNCDYTVVSVYIIVIIQ